MKRTTLPKSLKTLLNTSLYAVVATTDSQGRPWNTPVRVFIDAYCNLYWASGKASAHSHNLRHNSQAFIVLFDSQAPEGEGLGLYIQASVSELGTHEIAQALQIYDASMLFHSGGHKQFAGDCPQRLYKATPKAMWYNDAHIKNGHFEDFRVRLAV